jgi:hypothetical protein
MDLSCNFLCIYVISFVINLCLVLLIGVGRDAQNFNLEASTNISQLNVGILWQVSCNLVYSLHAKKIDVLGLF